MTRLNVWYADSGFQPARQPHPSRTRRATETRALPRHGPTTAEARDVTAAISLISRVEVFVPSTASHVQARSDRIAIEHQRAATVAHDTAIQPVQRLGNHPGAQNVPDGHHLRQHGMCIVLGMMRRSNLDPSQPLGRSAIFMHVPLGRHRVERRRDRRVRGEKWGVGGALKIDARQTKGAAGRQLVVGHRDERNVTPAGADRIDGVLHVKEIGGPARLGRIHVAQVCQAEILGHGQSANAGCIARAEIAIHVFEPKTGVGQSAVRDVRMKTRPRQTIRTADGVLKHSSDPHRIRQGASAL